MLRTKAILNFAFFSSSQERQKNASYIYVYDQNFLGEGVVDGEGGSRERCLKWGGGGGGH